MVFPFLFNKNTCDSVYRNQEKYEKCVSNVADAVNRAPSSGRYRDIYPRLRPTHRRATPGVSSAWRIDEATWTRHLNDRLSASVIPSKLLFERFFVRLSCDRRKKYFVFFFFYRAADSNFRLRNPRSCSGQASRNFTECGVSHRRLRALRKH